MPAALIPIILQLLMQYGPTIVNDIVNIGKAPDAITLDQLTALHSMLKDPASYFGPPKTA